MILSSLEPQEIDRAFARSQQILDIHEDELAHALRAENRRFFKQIQGALIKGEPFDLDAATAQHRSNLEQIYARHLIDTGDSFGQHILSATGDGLRHEEWANGYLFAAMSGIALLAADRFSNWSAYHVRRISNISHRRRQGEVDAFLKHRGDQRAATSAGAEVHAASQRSTVAAGDFTGKIRKRAWMSRLDGNERPAHHDAHKQIVALDQPFLVGGEQLRFPGDPRVSFGNWINCRCASALIME